MKYFIKVVWEAEGTKTYLVDCPYSSGADSYAEGKVKEITRKLKELGAQGSVTVMRDVQKIDEERDDDI